MNLHLRFLNNKICSENCKFFFWEDGSRCGPWEEGGGGTAFGPECGGEGRKFPADFAAHKLEPGPPRDLHLRLQTCEGLAVRREVMHQRPLPKDGQTERSKRGPGQVTDNPMLSAQQEPQIRTAALLRTARNRAPSTPPAPHPTGCVHPDPHPPMPGWNSLAALPLMASWGGPPGAAGAGRMRAGSHEELGLCSFLL